MCQSKNEALIFFQASSFQLLKLENLLRWSFFTFRMCPYLGPVTCDYALPIEVLSRERLRGRLYVFPSLLKKIKPVICWSQVYRAVHYKLEKTTNISRHAIFRVTSQSVSPGYNFSGLPASSSISSGKRSQPCENTRVSESGKAFLSPFLALAWVASFRVPLARDFSRYTEDIYPPTEDLVAGNNMSCNILFL